jgi:hypothetical protein
LDSGGKVSKSDASRANAVSVVALALVARDSREALSKPLSRTKLEL